MMMNEALFELAKQYKKCTDCSELKHIDEFYFKNKARGWKESKCSKCKNKIRNKYPPKPKHKKEKKQFIDKLTEEQRQMLIDNYNLSSLRTLANMLGVEYHILFYQHKKGNLLPILAMRQQKENEEKAAMDKREINPNDLEWERCDFCGRNELSCRCGWTAQMAGYDDGDRPSFLTFERD